MRIKTWMALTGVSALALLLFAISGHELWPIGGACAESAAGATAPSSPSAPQACELDNAQPKRRTSRWPMNSPPRQISWPQRALQLAARGGR